MQPTSAPYGTWESPLAAATVATAGLRLSSVAVDDEDIYWLEGRPAEGGRYVIVRRAADGTIADVTPPGFNVRTRVHEYGGGAFTVAGGVVYFVNFADQRVYEQRAGSSDVRALTPADARRYADLQLDHHRRRLIAVCEDHRGGGEPVNTIVAIPLDARGSPDEDGPQVLSTGYDFYSTPRLNPEGSRLVWICWNHPNMPWDENELWVAGLDAMGALVNARRAGEHGHVSHYQPGWAPDGALCYAADPTGFWNLYRVEDPVEGGAARVLASLPRSEFGRPEWVFGTATWTFAGSRLIASYTRDGRWHLARVDEDRVMDVAPGLSPHEWLAATHTHVVLVAGFPDRPDAVVRVDLTTGSVETLRAASAIALDPGDVSEAEPVEFPTVPSATVGRSDLAEASAGKLSAAGVATDADPSAALQTAHAFYYAPRNRRYTAPPGERPPLIVISHGGPTAAASATLNLNIQYWTTRGFAVVDVNYGGSSGYGREYRERLKGQWGIVDVADVIHAARYLAAQGKADPKRLVIRGGSAGGYTTLAALTFHPEVFAAGASYYGISDLEVLELDTHKFESRYSHSLIGPYPEAKDVYYARSPIHFVDRLSCPLILFQGLEDKVVPPNQSQMMADAVRAKGIRVEYHAFAGEQHGFRKAETIVACLERELAFYRSVLGLGTEKTEATE